LAAGRIDRVVVLVDDVEAVAAQLQAVLGIEMKIFDVASMQSRIGLCDEGFELVQPLGDRPFVSDQVQGPLVAIGLNVDDLDEVERRMAAQGFELTRRTRTNSGAIELSYACAFGGLPLVLSSYGEAGFVAGMGADTASELTPEVVYDVRSRAGS
jgi:hypothetical protein